MGASVVIVFISALSLINCADLENYSCYYDMLSNDTKPENVEFYNRLEQLMQSLVVTDDLLRNLSQTEEQLFFNIYMYVDLNGTQILFVPDSLELLIVENNNNVNESHSQSKYFVATQSLLENLTDAFYGKCEDENLIANEDYRGEDCYGKLAHFTDEALTAYIESNITVDGGLKMSLIRYLINDEDVCDADSFTEQDTEQGPEARRKLEISSSHTKNELRRKKHEKGKKVRMKKAWMTKMLNDTPRKIKGQPCTNMN